MSLKQELRLGRIGLALLCWGAGGTGSGADPAAVPGAAVPGAAVGGGVAWRKADPVPRRFGRFTDQYGCRWGLRSDGSIGLSGRAEERIGAFEWGAVLTVDGTDFTAQSAETTPDGSRVRLRGKIGEFEVMRDVWIDPARGAARFVETISNPTAGAKTVGLATRTEFADGLRSWQRFDGRPLADNQLSKDDAGVLFLQDPASRKPAVLMVLAEPRAEVKPKLHSFNNNQRWHGVWTLPVAEKASVSVAYWVVQRPDLTPDQAKPVVEAFWRGNRLVRPGFDAAVVPTLANFSQRSAGAGGSEAAGPEPEYLLGPLTALCERLGVERGREDIYWMSAGSVLAGEAQGGPMTIESRFGRWTLPLAEVAAVQGAGGRGRWPRVFLRDGTVLRGTLALPGWKVVGTKGWTLNVAPETLEALVLRTAPDDGVVNPPPAVLARLTSGEVLPLQLAAEETLMLTSPWGPVETAVSQIEALWHLRQPAPACRLWLKDGSRLTVFPAPRDLTAQSSRLGPVMVKVTDLEALWRPAAEVPDFEAEPEEISDLAATEGSACLLRGSNIIAATLADETLAFFSGTTETSIITGDIRELKRIDGGTESSPLFHLVLAGGAEFDGFLRSGTVPLRTSTGPWEVPVAHLLAVKHTPR